MPDLIRFPDDPSDGWRLALESAGIGAWYWNVTSGEVVLSETSRKVLGIPSSPSHVLFEEFFQAIHPDDILLTQANVTAIKNRSITHFSIEFRLKDEFGQFRWILSRGKVLKNEDRQQDIQAVGSHADISTRKDHYAAQLQAELYFQNAFKHAPIGMALVSPDGHLFEVNASFFNFLGYSRETLLKKSFQDITHPEDLEKDLEKLSQLVAGEIEFYHLEKRYIHKNGHTLPALLGVSIARNEDGSPNYFISQILDISDQKRHEQELKEARTAADRSNQAKSNFLASMSHEIRTPMNSVLGYAELLKTTDLDEEQSMFVEHISTSGDLLLHLINDILDFSKIEAGEMDLEFTTVKIQNIISQCANLLQGRAEEKNLDLVQDVDPALPEKILGDPHRLSQILLNLIGNAIKFTQKGTVTIRADQTNSKSDLKQLAIAIEDTGIGISPEKQKILFSPFKQADSSMSRKFGGTGLGLSISRHLTEAMGGSISLESTLNQGSIFTVRIPLPLTTSTGTTDIEENSDPNSIFGKSVLLYGEKASERLKVAMKLRSLGLIVTETKNFDRIKLLLERAPYDALIFHSPSFKSNKISDHPSSYPPLFLLTNQHDPLENLPANSYRIHLPFDPSEFTAAFQKIATTKPSSTLENRIQNVDTLKILVTEDNESNQKLMSSFINSLGHTLEIANNGTEAIEMIKKSAYDLILMDIQKPGPSGIETARIIRKMEENQETHPSALLPIPIYAVTANAVEGTREKCIDAGMDGFLLKPVRAIHLKNLFKKSMKRRNRG